MTALEQRRAALAAANARRRQGAEIKAQVAAGQLAVLDVLDLDVPPELLDGAGVLRVSALVYSAPGVGKRSAEKALVLAEVTADPRLRDLAGRPTVRARIAAAIRDLAPQHTPLRSTTPERPACSSTTSC